MKKEKDKTENDIRNGKERKRYIKIENRKIYERKERETRAKRERKRT
jgi:hypothetical protein